MKKTLFFLLCALITFSVKSQSKHTIYYAIGINNPMVSNKMASDSGLSINPKVGINACVGIDFQKESSSFLRGISTGIGFEQVGYNISGQFYSFDGFLIHDDVTTKLSYLYLPVIANFNVLKKDYFTWSFGVGTQVNYLVGYKLNDYDYFTVTNFGTIYQNITFENKKITANSIIDYGNGSSSNNTETTTMSQCLYNKIVINAVFNTRFQYEVTDNVALSLQLQSNYSINDVEKKGSIGVNNKLTILHYENDSYWQKDRPATKILNIGLLLGVNINLNHSKKYY